MKKELLVFDIVKYKHVQGYTIETRDIRFHWREGLLYHNVSENEVAKVIKDITDKMANEFDIDVLFRMK